jgi:hypothetical protein
MKVLISRITIGFCIGILITFYIKPETHLLFILLAIALFVLLLLFFTKIFLKHKLRFKHLFPVLLIGAATLIANNSYQQSN